MDSEIKKQAKTLKPMVRVGKSGVTDSLVEEVKKHLKKRNLVKVRFLKNSPSESTKELAQRLAALTDSEIVSLMGLTAVFYKKRK